MTNDNTDFGAIAAQLLVRHAPRLEAVEAAARPEEPDREALRASWVAERDRVLTEGRFPARIRDLLRLQRDDRGRAFDGKLPGVAAAREFAAGKQTALVLAGGTGAGKTTGAAWLAWRHGGARPGFVRSTELAAAGLYSRELHEWLGDRTLLVVDDLGTEFADRAGAWQSILDGLVDRAYSERQRIVFTTNVAVRGQGPTLADRIGPRVWSRWCEDSQITEVGNVDLRRAA